MASTVGQISALTSSKATSTSVLAETVLQDYGLAQKLLRLVNSAAFAQRGRVTTISRAVLLLGFERVRSVATGLILFEHLQSKARTRAFFLLKDPSAAIARFRFGLGQSAADMRAWIEVPLNGVDDLVSLAMRQHKDLVIKNISAPELSHLLPEWYRQRIVP